MQQIDIRNVKRHMARKHFVGDATQRVQIRPCRANLATPLLRSAIERLPACALPRLQHPCIVTAHIRNAQIQNLWLPLLVNHDAFRHQMAMDFIRRMGRINRTGQWLQYRYGEFCGNDSVLTMLLHPTAQCDAFHIFDDHVCLAVLRRHNIQHLRNPFMLNVLQRFTTTHCIRQQYRIVGNFFRQRLQPDKRARLFIAAF